MEIKNRDAKFKSIHNQLMFDYCAYTHLPGGCKRVGKCYKIHSAEVKGKINWPCRAYLTIKGCGCGNNCVYLHTPKNKYLASSKITASI